MYYYVSFKLDPHDDAHYVSTVHFDTIRGFVESVDMGHRRKDARPVAAHNLTVLVDHLVAVLHATSIKMWLS